MPFCKWLGITLCQKAKSKVPVCKSHLQEMNKPPIHSQSGRRSSRKCSASSHPPNQRSSKTATGHLVQGHCVDSGAATFLFDENMAELNETRTIVDNPGKTTSLVWKYFGFYKIQKPVEPPKVDKLKLVCKATPEKCKI